MASTKLLSSRSEVGLYIDLIWSQFNVYSICADTEYYGTVVEVNYFEMDHEWIYVRGSAVLQKNIFEYTLIAKVCWNMNKGMM